ncbi:MAG TPA: DUF4250 domain-containing protein [Candidatus Ventrimonas merdavium]|nr:DUF4250 domain-containing protein [Candidatus Ventrimonas merdavium]
MAAVLKDPVMMLSFVNTQLRDHFPSLEELCASLDLDRQEVEAKLEELDYHYSPEQNRFL